MGLLDAQRRFVEVNGAAMQLLGYPRRALIGHPVYEFVVGGPLFSEERWRAMLRESQFTQVADVRRQDGGRVTVDVAAHPALVDGRQLVLFVVIRADRRGRRVAHRAQPNSAVAKLTRRELDVVTMIALGATGPEIADELQVTHNTVRTHARNAMTKLGARSRAQLVAKALAEVLYRPDSS